MGQALPGRGVSEQAHDMPNVAATTTRTTAVATTTGGTKFHCFSFCFIIYFAFSPSVRTRRLRL